MKARLRDAASNARVLAKRARQEADAGNGSLSYQELIEFAMSQDDMAVEMDRLADEIENPPGRPLMDVMP